MFGIGYWPRMTPFSRPESISALPVAYPLKIHRIPNEPMEIQYDCHSKSITKSISSRVYALRTCHSSRQTASFGTFNLYCNIIIFESIVSIGIDFMFQNKLREIHSTLLTFYLLLIVDQLNVFHAPILCSNSDLHFI